MHHRRVHISGFVAVLLFFFSHALAGGTADTLEQKIQGAIDQNRVVDNLGNAFYQNPSGEFLLAPQNGDLRFGILIYNIDILPDKAVFSAGMAFRDPKSNQLVAFKSQQVTFSHSYGITGPVKLYLLDSVKVRMGKAVELLFLGNDPSHTYATFDCSGLKEFSVHGMARFHSDYLQPVNDTGAVLANVPLTAEFRFTTHHWQDMLAEVSLPPFQVKSAPGYVFRIEGAVLDLSETQNANSMAFPGIYTSRNLLGGNMAFWEGFYLEKGSVTLPRFFKNEQGNPLTLGVSRLLIDEFGFSGRVFAQNALAFEKGSLAGWNFSIDEISVLIELNQLSAGSLRGDLGLPVLPDTSRLSYYCRFDREEHYLFTVATKGNLSIPALRAASLQLTKNSFISAEIDHGNTQLQAHLNGKFLILAQAKDPSPLRIPDISFRDLHLSNVKPKFGIEYLGLSPQGDSAHCSHFPIQLTALEFYGKNDNYTLHAGFLLHLTEYASAGAGIDVQAKYTEVNRRDRFVFEKLGISSIAFDFEKSGIRIAGSADLFQQDPDYGNGFSGSIQFALNQPKMQAAARALFGTVGGLRYWYFDAETLWPTPGILLFPGVNVNGFVGGAWHHLTPWDGQKPLLHPEYGKVASGAVLLPSAKAGLGLKAGAYLNGGSAQTYQAKTVLELQFLSSGALARTLFYGDLELMGEKTQPKTKDMARTARTVPSSQAWNNYVNAYSPSAPVSGPFMLEWDFNKKCFFANSALYIKQAAGNTINGAYTNGLAGELSAYFASDKWYVRAGNPTRPLTAEIKMGELAATQAQSYIMAGSELPEAAPLPAEIAQFLGTARNPLVQRDVSNIAAGNGFALGMQLRADANAGGTDKKISVYARLKAIAGFDINAREYKQTVCAGSQNIPGLQGWYGTGKLYAFVQGKLGARAGKISVDVMTLTAALEMAMGAPSPTFATGATKVEFNLGGIFRFKSDVQIALGTPCNLQSQGSADSQILTETTPAARASNFGVFDPIKAKFSVSLNVKNTLPDGRIIEFKIKNSSLKYGSTSLNSHWILDTDGEQAFLELNSSLLPKTTYDLTIELEALEWKNGKSTVWVEYGKPLIETHNIRFTTGALPDSIPATNIAAAWPWYNQVNFYRQQNKTGFIQLKMAQDYLFNKPGTQVIARFTNRQFQNVAEVSITNTAGKLSFVVPSALAAGDVYHLRIVRQAVTSGSTSNASNSNNANRALQAQYAGSPANGNASNAPAPIKPVLLYESWFRCSDYPTLQAKLDAITVKSYTENPDGSVDFTLNSNTGEWFEPAEVTLAPNGPMQFVAATQGTPWYMIEGQRKTYSIFTSVPSGFLLSRDTQKLGYPCIRAMEYSQPGLEQVLLGDDQKLRKAAVNFGSGTVQIHYAVMQTVKQDLQDIGNRLDLFPGASQPSVARSINQYKSLFSSSTLSGSASSTGTPPGTPAVLRLPMASSLPFVSSAKTPASPSASLPAASAPTPLAPIIKYSLTNLYKPSTYPIRLRYIIPGTFNPITATFNLTLK